MTFTEQEKQLLFNCFFAEWNRLEKIKKDIKKKLWINISYQKDLERIESIEKKLRELQEKIEKGE